ncbi:MAG: ABC transporter permease [Oscillibacter sp.]|nr:ABC transporter permease [uncultured Oscillibacter sp.]MCI9460629.1 ABC transporter permease [Oscillibacter sp.]
MKKSDRTGSKLPAAGSLAAAVLLWLLASEARLVPSFLLPSPAAVCRALAEDAPVLLENAGVTLLEAALGLAAGILSALVLATLMHHVPVLYRALYPILVITQTIPTVALAPLLVLWMGFGMAPKVTLVALTTFFPIAVSLLEGYASTDRAAADLLRSMGAGRRQIFRYLEFPSALSHFFSGLRVSASYAVVGAVISEWLGGFQGLGVYMIRVKKAYAFDKMFAVILVIVAVSLLLMGLVTALRRRACPWEAFEKIERND